MRSIKTTAYQPHRPSNVVGFRVNPATVDAPRTVTILPMEDAEEERLWDEIAAAKAA